MIFAFFLAFIDLIVMYASHPFLTLHSSCLRASFYCSVGKQAKSSGDPRTVSSARSTVEDDESDRREPSESSSEGAETGSSLRTATGDEKLDRNGTTESYSEEREATESISSATVADEKSYARSSASDDATEFDNPDSSTSDSDRSKR